MRGNGLAKRRLEWRRAARADLLAILDYISDENADAAVRLLEEIEAKVSKLPDRPELYRKGRLAGLRDAGHNVCAPSAIYLHACGDVTLAGLKTFIAGFGLVSLGRARSLLNYMRHLGYLEPDPAASSPRRASYRVTPQFLESYTRHSASVLDAVSVVEPAVGLLQKNLGAPGVFEALVMEQSAAFAAGSAQARPCAAFYRVFLHRLAGIQILHGLVAEAPAFPPGGKHPLLDLRHGPPV